MKTLRLFSVLLALFIASWSCSDDEDGFVYEPVTADSELQVRSFTGPSLTNNMIGNQALRSVQVYLPKDYDAKGPVAYPVVYLLHGLPFSEEAYTNPGSWDPWIRPGQNWPFQTYPDFPAEGFKAWIDNMISKGTLDPMIIVMPNAASDAGYGFSFYTNSDLNGNFEDYIVTDMVNFIDSNYNTRSEASGRAVIGHSQGGYGAFKLGLLHPDKFGTVASHSGLLLLDAMLSLGPMVAAENPNGMTGPDPTKFMTSGLYAMSACWSPNLTAPFGVDLPMEYPSGAVIPEVAAKWYAHDVFNLLDSHIDNFRSLKGIYMDIGMNDELGMQAAYPFLIQKLDAYGVDYTYETFNGGHFTNAFERLATSLEFCSNSMKE